MAPAEVTRASTAVGAIPRCWVVWCLSLLVVLAGCDWWLRITEVTGTVRIDGKPTSGIQVVFEPLAPDRPRAVAVTNHDGIYRLGRQGPGKKSGAAQGRYRVEVLFDADGADPIVIPPEFNVNSSLEFEVLPGKANVFDIAIPRT